MNRVRALAGLVFLAVLTAGAPARILSEPRETLPAQVAGIAALEGPHSGLQKPSPPAGRIASASLPVEETLRSPSSKSLEGFSGGSTGTLLIGAALLAAAALILVVVIPW